MCLDAEHFNQLCYLYPKTATSLKYRALDRRNFFLKTMQAQEIEYGVNRDPKTGLKKQIYNLQQEIVFDDDISDYSKVKLLRSETDAANSESKQEKETLK